MPADLVINSLSTEMVQVPVQVTQAGVPYNPTGDVVQFAFVVGSSYPATWYQGSWTTNLQGIYIAQCLVGPANSGVVLLPATYVVWIKITDNPEIPVRSAGSIQIT